MDLLKSVKSEDLSKDLQVNPRISPQKHEGFHDELDELDEIIKSKQTDIDRSVFRTICVVF